MVLEQLVVNTHPLVTIGIPTYNRAKLLRRALDSVANQSYSNLEVIIADNCSPDDEVERVIEAYSYKIVGLRYIKHIENIGAINNFFYLLAQAKGKYFMWLADDDELSPNYVSSLVRLLESNSDAATAAGHWVLMLDETNKKLMPTASFPQKSPFLRCLRYIWATDDAFFYGLHRTDLLKRASFKGYWWPNKTIITNWAYVFLLDMVLNGRVLLPIDTSVQFINHDCTAKDYRATESGKSVLFAYLLRRINIHFLYWKKAAQSLGYFPMPLVVMVSCLAILREFFVFPGAWLIRRSLRYIRGTSKS